MTRDEILGMKPGRELDALVAEKVMGWGVCTLIAKDVCWVYKNGRLNVLDGEYFGPSTDISAAMEAAEKFGTWQLTNMGVGNPNREYRAIVQKNHYVAYASTAPEVICKAALLAVLEELT